MPKTRKDFTYISTASKVLTNQQKVFTKPDMETNTSTKSLRPKLGAHKAVTYKMPIPMIEKINRIALRKGINQSMVIRGAVDSIDEGGEGFTQ
jgi:hypothetical protein